MISKGIWKAVLTPYGFCVLAGNIKTAVAERYFDLKPTAKELKELHDNARLIAAAPELLDACKGLMEECDNGSARFDDPEPDSIFIKAKDAIAKAEKKNS